MADHKVKEKRRVIHFRGGDRAIFHNVRWFNSDGSFLRFGCDEGYILINTTNVLYIQLDEKDRVR